jgi:DNA-binding MarR family transcriptional regulator
MTQPARLNQLAAELNSIAIHLLRRIRSTDANLGLTPARLSALSVLVFGGPLSMSQLAEAEQVAAPTMSRIIAALERDGLVRREVDLADARAVRLSATPAAQGLLERGRQLRIKRLAAELRSLSEADRVTLSRAAEILRALNAHYAARTD